MRWVNTESLSQPSSCLASNTLKKPLKATFHPQFNLNNPPPLPLPPRNAVLGKGSCKGNICGTSTSEVKGKLRQLKTFQSFPDPSRRYRTEQEQQDGCNPNQRPVTVSWHYPFLVPWKPLTCSARLDKVPHLLDCSTNQKELTGSP